MLPDVLQLASTLRSMVIDASSNDEWMAFGVIVHQRPVSQCLIISPGAYVIFIEVKEVKGVKEVSSFVALEVKDDTPKLRIRLLTSLTPLTSLTSKDMRNLNNISRCAELFL